jgi:two-component system, response regulator
MKEKIILLVEDRQADIELTIESLKENRLHNEVVVLRDGAQALDYLFGRGEFSDLGPNRMPTVVLLDLKLPKIGGLEVLRQIRENKETKLIPVVILSSSKEESDMIEGYQLGCNSYVIKPLDFDQFSSAIRSLELYWMLINEEPPQI